LTNGIEYLFFTDIVKQNVMDYDPFFTFNILNFSEEDVNILKMFMKDNIDSDKVKDFAVRLSFRGKFRDYFIQQSVSPSNDFVSFILKSLGFSNINSLEASILVSKEIKNLFKLDEDSSDKKSIIDVDFKFDYTEDEKDDQDEIKIKKENRLKGSYKLSELNAQNINFTKPRYIMIFGDIDYEKEVTCWADVVYESVLYCLLLGKDLDYIDSIDDSLEVNKGWIRKSKEGLRNYKQIKENLYVDVSGSAFMSLTKIKKVYNKLGIDLDNVIIELV